MRAWLGQVADAVIGCAVERIPLMPAESGASLKSVLDVLGRDYPHDADRTPGEDDRLTFLTRLFGLDETSVSLLLAALAPELDGTFGIAYDILTGRAGHGACTVGLALELCGVASGSGTAFAHLDPSAPLRQERLLDVVGDATWPRRTVRVSDRVVSFLAGVDIPDAAVAAVAVDTLPFECAESGRIARALDLSASLVWIHGPRGTAGLSTAVAALQQAGLLSLVIDLRRAEAGGRLAAVLADAVREAALAGAGLVVGGGEIFADGPLTGERRAALRVLERARVPLIAVGSCVWQAAWLHGPVLTFDAPVVRPSDRSVLWRDALGDSAEPGSAEALAGLRLNPDEVLRAARYARQHAGVHEVPLDPDAVRTAVRALGRTTATLSTRTTASFADLVLPQQVSAELDRLVQWATHRDEVLARGPVHGKGDRGIGLSALFTGGPGTGKTLSAHVVANELGLELLQVDLPSIVDKYIGETEKNLERVFHEAEQRNVVLFFDEADALFGSRSEVKDARDRYANQEVAYLLQRMEHFDGITLLATNLRGNLDKAFSRRMHFIIHFPDPDEPTRRRLWAQLLANAGPIDDEDPVDVNLLAASGDLTGGDIRNVVLAATYDATAGGGATGMRHVLAARDREFRKLGRRLS